MTLRLYLTAIVSMKELNLLIDATCTKLTIKDNEQQCILKT